MGKTMKKKDDYDRPWKEVLDTLFEYFLSFFFPEIHAQIDWSRKWEFYDKEFQKLIQDSELESRRVDKLVKVWLKEGAEIWVLIHVEFQSYKDTDFAYRMFDYHTLIYKRYRQPVASLAVFGDTDPNWKPDPIGYTIFGKKLSFPYFSIKILDYLPQWNEMAISANPFAIITAAYLKAITTKKKKLDRLREKVEIVKDLLIRGFDQNAIRQIFRFVDVVLWLPQELEKDFKKQLDEFRGEQNMSGIMIPYEELIYEEGVEKGIERGIERGILQKSQEAVIEVLETRFDQVPDSLLVMIHNITDCDTLSSLHKTAIKVKTLDEFRKMIDIAK